MSDTYILYLFLSFIQSYHIFNIILYLILSFNIFNPIIYLILSCIFSYPSFYPILYLLLFYVWSCHILFDPFPAYPIYWSISCIQSYSILSFIQVHLILTFPCPYLSHLIQSACLICHILFHETHNKDKLRFRIKTFLRSVKEKRVEKWVRVFAGNLNFFILRFFDMSWKSSSRNKIRF